MPNQPNLIIVDRAKLDEFLSGVFPQSPTVRDDVIDGFIAKPTPRGVTPNRLGRGETIVKQAIRLNKLTGTSLDTCIELLITTTDVWEQRGKLRVELVQTLHQVRTFLRERLAAIEDTASAEDQQTMQRTMYEIEWRIQDLEKDIAAEGDQVERLRNAV